MRVVTEGTISKPEKWEVDRNWTMDFLSIAPKESNLRRPRYCYRTLKGHFSLPFLVSESWVAHTT
jgi:hypothetical protein